MHFQFAGEVLVPNGDAVSSSSSSSSTPNGGASRGEPKERGAREAAVRRAVVECCAEGSMVTEADVLVVTPKRK